MSLCKIIFFLFYIGRRHELIVHWHHSVVWFVFSTVRHILQDIVATTCYVCDVESEQRRSSSESECRSFFCPGM